MQGLVDGSCMVWTDGMEAWAPLRDTELGEALPPGMVQGQRGFRSK